MASVWGFGTSAMDLRLITADYGEGYKDKLLARKTIAMGGGSTSNFLVQAARLGIKAGLLTKLGNDPIGERILCMMRDAQVDVSGVIRSDTEWSPFNVAVYAGEKRRRVGGFLLPNALASWTAAELEQLAAHVSQGDYVLIEVGEIPLESCLAFAKSVHARGARIILDVDLDPIRQCGADRETVFALFGEADFLMPNITSLATLYPEGSALDITRQLSHTCRCTVITTLGAEGAVYSVCGAEAVIVPGRSITPVDTVGAGDAFHGGFAAGLVRGKSLTQAIELGNVCGAHVCLAFGIRDVMITKAQLPQYGIQFE